jgi:ParB-like nuclease domain
MRGKDTRRKRSECVPLWKRNIRNKRNRNGRMTETWPIDAIIVGGRFRRDFGDIEGLAASIADLGLLQPIVISPDGRLLAGHRRLLAYRLLGRTEIPVFVKEERHDRP